MDHNKVERNETTTFLGLEYNPNMSFLDQAKAMFVDWYNTFLEKFWNRAEMQERVLCSCSGCCCCFIILILFYSIVFKN